MHRSGLTTEQLTPALDYTFPWRDPYRLGLTNLAHRPTPKSEQLTMGELERGVPELIGKAVEYRPRVVCFVGKQIGQVWLSVLQKRGALDVHPPVRCTVPRSVLGFWFEKPKKGDRRDTEFPPQDAGYGVLPACVVHDDGSLTLFFSTPSTSARVTHHQLPGKVRIMSHVSQLLEQFPKAEPNDSEPSGQDGERGAPQPAEAQGTADNAGPTRTVYIPVIDLSKAQVIA